MHKRKNNTRGKLLAPALVTVAATCVLAVLIFRGYTDQKYKNYIIESSDKLVSQLKDAGFNSASVFERCDKDYSNKFDTSYSCGVGAEIKDNNLKEDDFSRLINTLTEQDVFYIPELIDNMEIKDSKRSTFSKAVIESRGIECNVSLSYGYITRPTNFYMELWCNK